MPKLLDVDVETLDWLNRSRKKFSPGSGPDEPVEVTTGVANELLRSIIRFVADIPAGSTPEVVWQLGEAELEVDTSSISLVCSSGLIRVGLVVDCDQVDKPVRVVAPIAVGTPKLRSGLVMSTYRTVEAPQIISATWSEAITAFAWEALLELASRLSAEVGSDTRGRPLVPVDIAATTDTLIVTAMARHDTTARDIA